MTDTPQSPIKFSQRMTREDRVRWLEHMGANRRAARAYAVGDTDQQTWQCEVCGKRTELPTRRHQKCEDAA